MDSQPNGLLETLPATPHDLFPLPLSAFEKYLIWDERPEQPMTSFIELHFLDPIQVPVFEEAIALATRIHPLLVCTVGEHHSQLCWIHRPDYLHRLIPETQQPPLVNGRVKFIDLTQAPGIQFWYRQEASGHSRILIQLHHAATDGVGLRRFLIDAMTIYAHRTNPGSISSEQRPPWNKVDLGLLKRRYDFSDSFSGPPSKPLTTWQRLKNAHYFHFQPPEPLRTTGNRPSANGPSDHSEPLEHIVFDREISAEILDQARLRETGLNELSLALLFETCSLWNQQAGASRKDMRLRLLMPYDLRSRIDLRMPATNRLSFTFLGRRLSQCQDFQALLASVSREIDDIRCSQLPLDFVTALQSASRFPRLMKWVMRRSRSMATAVLTYAGDISRGMQKFFPEQSGARIVGDVRLDKILAAPPVRVNTHWSLGLCVNWGQLCISAAWNRESLSRQECIDLLGLYRSRWMRWLSDKPETVQR